MCTTASGFNQGVVIAVIATALLATATHAHADDASDLAKKLSNPVAALISVPLRLDYDTGYGANGGTRWTLNAQPVIPMSMSENWNLISRTIIPLITQHDVTGAGSSQTGFGDLAESIYFSPKAPMAGGWMWGAGPVVSLPTGRAGFSIDQWAVGPTGVVLKQTAGWTYGALVSHLWGISHGEHLPNVDLPDLNATGFQPFVSKSIGPGKTVGVNLDATYDWERSSWVVPLNVSVSQILKIGPQLVSLGAGVRTYLVTPTGGPNWGLRVTVTLLYPK